MTNYLTLAVAGARKTQGIIDYCASLPSDKHVLVLTYTQTNQIELKKRLSQCAGSNLNIEVMGWFTFLIRHFAKPFLPFKYHNKRVIGFNFDGYPHRMAKGINRFLDSRDSVYACELGRLAYELIEDSKGCLLYRLECIYDEIIIDEVQDLSSYDWEIIDILFNSAIDIRMVGDIRQSVLTTNVRSTKNKVYAYADVIKWFRERESKGILNITENSVTWRCHPEIAKFSDTIFNVNWGFSKTQSKNQQNTGHDGVFLVKEKDVHAYVSTFDPKCLRHSKSSGKAFQLDFLNFKLAKGATYDRVLIIPTDGIKKFIQQGVCLEPVPAASFYVAVTRAAQSVAIVLNSRGKSSLPYWEPSV